MIDQTRVRTVKSGTRLRIGGLLLGFVLAAGTAVYAGSPGDASPATDRLEDAPDLTRLEARADRLEEGWEYLGAVYDTEVAPLVSVLRKYSRDEALVNRIAAALVREARANDLDAQLLLAVLLVENPWLDPEIRSFVGAIGLMQVMPVHRGGWGCGADLEDVDANICTGARVFAHYLDRTDGDMEQALLRYNGCVRGTNTPNCHLYPTKVLARAAQHSLAVFGQGPSAASP